MLGDLCLNFLSWPLLSPYVPQPLAIYKASTCYRVDVQGEETFDLATFKVTFIGNFALATVVSSSAM